jgi:SAM-dependent methyltransferase
MNVAQSSLNSLELNVGCGSKRIEGTFGLDRFPTGAVDVLSDIEATLPFKSNSFRRIYATQVLEHITNLHGFLSEAHRLLSDGGRLVIEVPYFRASWSHIDPTHVRHFTIMSFDYFVRGKYLNSETNAHATQRISFSNIKKSVVTGPSILGLKKIASRLALRFPEWFENSIWSSVFVFHALRIELTK